ncbi:efflux RND transporter periplasmic adaptor subunit [Flavobacterium psychrotolerans]|uniref:RND transporter n=1 Tax=Flavobacterium psychrotolerans TaxID=2169410 RepID=A0A2U1JG43_9FLAO|nr:efflux RND transporter periplasmic adaptor subunit [Flavobacterium psychrotolerans]PWA03954.1 RND transporter [Flavobacterium psychrotolerans]
MKKLILFIVAIPLFFSCKGKTETETAIDVSVPVTLTSIDTTGIRSYTELNATATYLVKTIIKANATGYLSSVNVASNDFVNSGKVLFTLKTRESKVLGNTINKIDPSLNFGDDIKVKATSNGFVNFINVQQGDYVQDGDQLAIVNDANSFAIVLSLPYELKKYVSVGATFDAFLPDGKAIKVKVKEYMPTVDATSQTQNVILKVNGKEDIPENLIVKVRINKTSNTNSISLPKAAVLSNETETDFWIMKMIDANTAIKIPIQKGIETEDKVEILSPVLSREDRILITGNYGVADTIKVKVIKNY